MTNDLSDLADVIDYQLALDIKDDRRRREIAVLTANSVLNSAWLKQHDQHVRRDVRDAILNVLSNGFDMTLRAVRVIDYGRPLTEADIKRGQEIHAIIAKEKASE
jgi:hypothetical protein